MPLENIDPVTYEVPAGKTLLFYEIVDEATVYKYKLLSGTIRELSHDILISLAIEDTSLPCLIDSSQLLRYLNENFASVADLTLAVASKASISYVKQLTAQKVSRTEFDAALNEKISESTFSLALAEKANTGDVTDLLASKIDRTAVLSVEQTLALFEAYTGALIVKTIAERDAIEPGSKVFIWVLSPSADADLEDPTIPALYKWTKSEEDVGSYLYLASATTSVDSSGSSTGGISIQIVNDIAARNALEDKTGLVWVRDASADVDIESGGALYIYDVTNTEWIRISGSTMSTDIQWTVNGIIADETGNFSVPAAAVGAAELGHTHPMSEVIGLADAIATKAPVSHTHDLVSGFSISGVTQDPIAGLAILQGSSHLKVTSSGKIITLEALPYETAMTASVINAADEEENIQVFEGSTAEWEAFTKDPAASYLVMLFD